MATPTTTSIPSRLMELLGEMKKRLECVAESKDYSFLGPEIDLCKEICAEIERVEKAYADSEKSHADDWDRVYDLSAELAHELIGKHDRSAITIIRDIACQRLPDTASSSPPRGGRGESCSACEQMVCTDPTHKGYAR